MKYAIKRRNKNQYFGGFVNESGGEIWTQDLSKAKLYNRLDAASQATLMNCLGDDVCEKPLRVA